VLAQPRTNLLTQARLGQIAEHAHLELTRLAGAAIDVDEALDIAAVRAESQQGSPRRQILIPADPDEV